MSSPIISAFLIDDDNGAKFGLHGISAHEVLQVLHNTHVVRRNRRGHRATHQVIGLTTASSLAGKHEAREKEDNGGQGKDELLRKEGMDGDVDFLREALRVLVEGIRRCLGGSVLSMERVAQRVPVPGVGYPCGNDGPAHSQAQRGELLPEPAGLLAVSRPTWKVYPRGGWTIWSRGIVSRICQELDVVVEGFLGRPLDGGPYPYLWLDALTQKVREAGRIVNVSVVVATAVNGEGKREIIGMDVGTSEDGAFWLAFLRSLSARGLSGVELVVSDAHQGLRGAIAAVFGGASWQRCRTHFMTQPAHSGPQACSALAWPPWSAPSTSNPPPMRYTPNSTG